MEPAKKPLFAGEKNVYPSPTESIVNATQRNQVMLHPKSARSSAQHVPPVELFADLKTDFLLPQARSSDSYPKLLFEDQHGNSESYFYRAEGKLVPLTKIQRDDFIEFSGKFDNSLTEVSLTQGISQFFFQAGELYLDVNQINFEKDAPICKLQLDILDSNSRYVGVFSASQAVSPVDDELLPGYEGVRIGLHNSIMQPQSRNYIACFTKKKGTSKLSRLLFIHLLATLGTDGHLNVTHR
jgi:hypothetical protein